MYKTTRLKKDLNIHYLPDIVEFLNPPYLYLSGTIVSDLQQDSQVYKDSLVTTTPLNFSPVSGKIHSISKDQIIIKNDYMEIYESAKQPSAKAEYTLDIVLKLLKNYNFSNSTILKELASHPKTIVVNAIDDVPYLKTREFILHHLSEQILETCEILYETADVNEIIIALKNTDTANIELYNNNIGSFPYITYRYLNDEYPLSFKEILTQKLSLNYYNTLIITPEELLEIYEIVKRLKPIAEVYLSIIQTTNDSLVLKTKIGTKLSTIITEYSLPKDKKYYLDNLLKREEILNPEDFIIQKDVKAIYILDDLELKPTPCINCGLCYRSCPFGLNPRNIQDLEKCRQCGLCTYTCPANIRLGSEKHAQQ